jgi:hypothetical protein
MGPLAPKTWPPESETSSSGLPIWDGKVESFLARSAVKVRAWLQIVVSKTEHHRQVSLF